MPDSSTSFEVSRLLYHQSLSKPLWPSPWHWQQCRSPSKPQWFLGQCGSLGTIPNRPQLIQGLLGRAGLGSQLFTSLGSPGCPFSRLLASPRGPSATSPTQEHLLFTPLFVPVLNMKVPPSLPQPISFFCCRMQAIISVKKMLVTLGYLLLFSLYRGASSDPGSCRWVNQASSHL